MALYVRLKGELPPIFLPVGPTTPVGQALAVACQLWRKPPEKARLLFGGQPLADPAKPLSEYGVGPDDLLELEVAP